MTPENQTPKAGDLIEVNEIDFVTIDESNAYKWSNEDTRRRSGRKATGHRILQDLIRG